jgi:hypothetical protein
MIQKNYLPVVYILVLFLLPEKIIAQKNPGLTKFTKEMKMDFDELNTKTMNILNSEARCNGFQLIMNLVPADTQYLFSEVVKLSRVFGAGKNPDHEFCYPLQEYNVFSFHVFDRFGKTIFISENPTLRWNGKVNNTGEEVALGSYLFVLSYQLKGKTDANAISGELNLKKTSDVIMHTGTLLSPSNSPAVIAPAIEKEEYLGLNISPMTGLFGISYYDRNSTNLFQDGFILHGFFKSSWLGYSVNYMDLQVVEIEKSGFYGGIGVAWFDTESETTKVKSDRMYGFAWSSGYNAHLGPVFLGVGAHFFNFSSSRWTLNIGFKI